MSIPRLGWSSSDFCLGFLDSPATNVTTIGQERCVENMEDVYQLVLVSAWNTGCAQSPLATPGHLKARHVGKYVMGVGDSTGIFSKQRLSLPQDFIINTSGKDSSLLYSLTKLYQARSAYRNIMLMTTSAGGEKVAY